ncbi:hypothetical protein OPV22_018157 [Ensete ventricosum]|uniref:Exostosin GT47 domain-containing protein n=1 Tax=Ensete ventricosum TaxID=4639 RepID=A0AAV8QTP2_ENSVE|nr:hypothetical protein OPV22_018157 [Ensete ventricosum]
MKPSITLLLAFSVLSLLPLLPLLLLSSKSTPHSPPRSPSPHRIRVFVADLPRSFNYGLLDQFWSLSGPDSRIGVDLDARLRSTLANSTEKDACPPYPESPLLKQHSAEYWLLGDLETPEESRGASFAERVYELDDADVVFVPFFSSLSAQMELGWGRKGRFRKRERNDDYGRQREVVDRIKGSEAWRRSGGRDHVFVMADPVAMWHVRSEIAAAIFLVLDFDGRCRFDSKASNGSSSHVIMQHAEVSSLKDVIVPYTHLLPRLHLSQDQRRRTLLYFRGARHRHRGGLIREKLWELLADEPDVIMEEGSPDATGLEQSTGGMRESDFCLHPAGDTPASCRLFDAIVSLCIPVIVSDSIELPFEGTVDYSDFSVFVSAREALRAGWLVNHLRGVSEEERDRLRRNMARVQPMFEYDNGDGNGGGIGPVPSDGAVNHIWKKVHEKLPMIREALIREKRTTTPEGGAALWRQCQCI